jgi:hypothetical protein
MKVLFITNSHGSDYLHATDIPTKHVFDKILN